MACSEIEGGLGLEERWAINPIGSRVVRVEMQISLVLGLILDSKLVSCQPRIVGGTEAQAHRFTWMANINWRYQHFCGGVFISRSALITAAHCSKHGKEEYDVEFHRHDIGLLPEEESGETFGVESIKVHPGYLTSQSRNDIAVWRLDSSIRGELDPILLASPDQTLKTGSLATALGWGWDQAGGSFSDVLMRVDIPIADGQQCRKAWRGLNKPIYLDSQLCAAGQGGRDTCVGDSGGPLFKWKGSSHILIGLTSFGKPCANRNTPSIWTRVSYHLDFIKDNSSY